MSKVETMMCAIRNIKNALCRYITYGASSKKILKYIRSMVINGDFEINTKKSMFIILMKLVALNPDRIRDCVKKLRGVTNFRLTDDTDVMKCVEYMERGGRSDDDEDYTFYRVHFESTVLENLYHRDKDACLLVEAHNRILNKLVMLEIAENRSKYKGEPAKTDPDEIKQDILYEFAMMAIFNEFWNIMHDISTRSIDCGKNGIRIEENVRNMIRDGKNGTAGMFKRITDDEEDPITRENMDKMMEIDYDDLLTIEEEDDVSDEI